MDYGIPAVTTFGISKRKVLPTFGVSFGLPYPSGAYPPNAFGQVPAQNQHFGSISPNGLDLGLINVNPLVSFQVSKTEYGEKVVKPLVNLHVTPNENIIHKVGKLFHKKPLVQEHYHHHDHYHPEVHYAPDYHDYHDNHEHIAPVQVSGFDSHHGFENHFGSHFENNFNHNHNFNHNPNFNHFQPEPYTPQFTSPSGFGGSGIGGTGGGVGFGGTGGGVGIGGTGGGFGIGGTGGGIGGSGGGVGGYGENLNPPSGYGYGYERSLNVSKNVRFEDDGKDVQDAPTAYANNYQDYRRTGKQLNDYHTVPTQAPGKSEGSNIVKFPNSRRRRSVDSSDDDVQSREKVWL